MDLKMTYPHIVKTPGVCGGKACIRGTRIRVMDIVAAVEHQGLSPDEVCDQYPELTLGQIHGALAYYYDNRDDVRAEIESEKEKVERFRRDHPDQEAR
jgi:uncharacterized protein (DUF433 family)